jgi:hypothetical protein
MMMTHGSSVAVVGAMSSRPCTLASRLSSLSLSYARPRRSLPSRFCLAGRGPSGAPLGSSAASLLPPRAGSAGGNGAITSHCLSVYDRGRARIQRGFAGSRSRLTCSTATSPRRRPTAPGSRTPRTCRCSADSSSSSPFSTVLAQGRRLVGGRPARRRAFRRGAAARASQAPPGGRAALPPAGASRGLAA